MGDSPFRLAYDFAMIQCAWAMKELGTGDHVAFVCDECEEHSSLAYEAYRKLKEQNTNAARYMGTFSMQDEKKADVLQAADAVVFEVRRLLQLALGSSGREQSASSSMFWPLRGSYFSSSIQSESIC